MKVVKQKSTGKIVYRQSPDFEQGKGIINASIFNQIAADDLEEVVITRQEWDDVQKIKRDKTERDEKIDKEMWDLAEQSLKDKGKL